MKLNEKVISMFGQNRIRWALYHTLTEHDDEMLQELDSSAFNLDE